MEVTTSNGTILNTDELGAPHLTKWAQGKGFKNIICCVATFQNGAKEYVLLEDNSPIYSNTSFEAVSCHIDILACVKYGRATGKKKY